LLLRKITNPKTIDSDHRARFGLSHDANAANGVRRRECFYN
jgi:hypothetical protein